MCPLHFTAELSASSLITRNPNKLALPHLWNNLIYLLMSDIDGLHQILSAASLLFPYLTILNMSALTFPLF